MKKKMTDAVLHWFEESDDEDDSYVWHAALSQPPPFEPSTPLPWFTLATADLDASAVVCFPWWQVPQQQQQQQHSKDSVRLVRQRLANEAELAHNFIRLVRNHSDDDDDDDGSTVALHVDTFAHKLARLKHLNQADLRQLHRVRCSLGLQHSDDFRLLPCLPPLPPPRPLVAPIVAGSPLPSWLRAIVVPLLAAVDAVTLAQLAATCRALNSAASHDKLWKRLVQARFGADVRRVNDSVSYRRLYCTLATFEMRRRRRRAAALASLDALGALPREVCVHAVALCGLKRTHKRRVFELLRAARPHASATPGASALHWRVAESRVDVLDVGRAQLFGGARGNGASIVPASALVYVVDNFAPVFFSCRPVVHMLHEVARLRGVRVVLIYCLMWHVEAKFAVEAERAAQELFTGALRELRLEARLYAVDPRSGAGIDAGLAWLEQTLT